MTPSAWWQPDDSLIHGAREAALAAVASPQAVEDLATYYSKAGNYAGATFTSLPDNPANHFTPADLLAITTLSVSVAPRSVRRLLDGESVAELEKLSPQLDLASRDIAEKADAMGAFYQYVKDVLEGNKWVTASKLCARKRPALFPVRDSVVCTLLGLTGQAGSDWPAFAAIIRDDDVRGPLREAVADAATREGVDMGLETPLLRHLDVVLWMRGIRGQ